jgi:hypothetical protein
MGIGITKTISNGVAGVYALYIIPTIEIAYWDGYLTVSMDFLKWSLYVTLKMPKGDTK